MVSSAVYLIYSWLEFLPTSTKGSVSNEQAPWTCLIVSGQRCVRIPQSGYHANCTTDGAFHSYLMSVNTHDFTTSGRGGISEVTGSMGTTCRTPDEIPAQCTWSPPVGYIVWVIHQGAREGQWSEVCLYPNPLTKPTGTISVPSVYLISDRLN